VLKLFPTPSNSGITVNAAIQITALQAGKECTLTIHHEKANSDVVLYCIIPGENRAAVKLDRAEINMIEGDGPVSLTATITNAQEDDYTNLQWSIQQDDEIAAISGSGKKISVLPKKAGTAVVTAVVPSSQMSAACTVTVETPRTIRFSHTTMSTYPFGVQTLRYTVTPESETGTVVWTIGDSSHLTIVEDDKNGILKFSGTPNEGTTTITGTTASRAKATVTVTNGWRNAFSVEKSRIRSVPVNNHDGTFDVAYEVRPACAQIYVMVPQPDKLTLKAGTYENFDTTTKRFLIKSSQHEQINDETGTASGTIRFEPRGEINSNVIITAHNPTSMINPDGSRMDPYDIASKTINMQIYYTSYTFTPYDISIIGSPAGIYSRYDTTTGNFVIGDGEDLRFKLRLEEQNGTPQDIQVRFTPNTSEERENISLSTAAPGIDGFITVKHKWDYGPEKDDYYGLESTGDKVVEQYNRAVRAVVLAGTIEVQYRMYSIDSTTKYSFPLYVEIRNCRRDY
jgi:hypothetical protein